jgi:hypothetical protein
VTAKREAEERESLVSSIEARAPALPPRPLMLADED